MTNLLQHLEYRLSIITRYGMENRVRTPGFPDARSDARVPDRRDASRRQEVDAGVENRLEVLDKVDEAQPRRIVEFRQEVDVATTTPGATRASTGRATDAPTSSRRAA